MVHDTPRITAAASFRYPYRGLKFLFCHPRLLGYVAVPAAVNTLLFTALVWFAGSRFGRWVEALLPRGDAWYWSVVFYALWLVFALVLFLLVVYTFTLVGNLLLAPFNDLLSEKVEWVHTGNRLEEPFRLGAFLADMKRSFRAEIGRLLLFALGFALLLTLHFFPPVGTAVYGVAATAYTLFFLGWEYLDYTLERWHFPFRAKRRAAFSNLGIFFGFGAGAALLLLIPVVNFLAIPVCVAGGTLLVCDLHAAGRLPALPGRGGTEVAHPAESDR